MKLETLHEFVIVAKHLNFTKAAAELYTSQPGLSARIIALEKTLGYPLFERANNKVVLTSAGAVLLEYAQKILSDYNEALEKAEEISKSVPPLRITSIPPTSPYHALLPDRTVVPYTFIDLDINTSPLDALQEGVVDVALGIDYSITEGFSARPEAAGLSFFPIGSSSNSICMMSDHELAKKKTLTSKDLDYQTVVIHSGSHFDLWSKIVQIIIGRDIKLFFRMNQIESISNLSVADFGNSIYVCGGDNTHQLLAPREDVVIFDQLDDKPLTTPIALMCRSKDLEDTSSSIRQYTESFLGKLSSN